MVLTCKPSAFQPLILMHLYIFCYLIQIAAREPKGSNGLDTIVSGQPLYGNETLISKGRKFELGFFTPRPNYTYVGMWYKYIPVQTVVWVANREAPIRHFSNNTRLVLADDGSLILFSEWNKRIWALNNSVGSSSVPNKGVLLDNGNFVLSDGLNDIWQSFDHPTDTWLPGGKIGVDNNLINKRQLLTSWKDQNDPSAAEYLSFGMDLEGSPELFLFYYSQIQWRSGAWDNHSFTSFPSNYSNFSYNLISQAKYFNYVVNGNTTFRYVLDRRGLLHMGWSERTKLWEIFLFYPLRGDGAQFDLEPFKKHIKFQVPVAVFITIPLVFSISIAYFFWRIWRKKQKKKGAGETNKYLLFLNLEISRKQNRDRNNITTGNIQGETTVLNLLQFSFSSISAATNNFSPANKLGEGGFGPVYKRYYDFDPKHGTKNDAREALNTHMRRNMRKTLCNERRRIKKIIEKKGGSFIDHRPPYLTEAVWKPFCDHWESPTFQKKSDAAKEAREHQKIPHTSGAISFQRRSWDIRDKTGEVPTLYELFIRLHTKDKDNKEFTSEVVRIIVEKFLAKCVEDNVDPHAAPIDTWVEVVGVRKNAIIGLPRTSASELIALPPASGKRRRRRSVDDESGASTSRSVVEHISDGLVMQAVDRTVAFAHAHPDQFDLAPEQVNMLAQSVTEGVIDLPPDHPLTMETMKKLVQVMVSVLGDVHGDNRSTSKCNKGKSIAREDDHGSDDDDGGQSPPRQSRSGDRNGIWIRGD